MKVLLVNGSAKINGTTASALNLIKEAFLKEGIESEIFNLGGSAIADCNGCGMCKGEGCIIKDDIVNPFIEKAKEFDGYVFATPVYYAHPSGRILDFMDRVFYSGGKALKHKPAMSVAVARRAGTIASLDVLNKYFLINQMPLISGTYWTEIHGTKGEDIIKDEEGVETLVNGCKNMAFMLKAIDIAVKQGLPYPDTKKTVRTNFIK